MIYSETESIHSEEQIYIDENVHIEEFVPIDASQKVRSPWRRYFARTFDFYVYGLFLFAFQALVLNVDSSKHSTIENLLISYFAYLLMIFIEPLLLSTVGTTPGKWLLGLRVTDNAGQKLSYVDGLSRTVTLFWRGHGLNIPIYNYIRLWNSYKDCEAGETLDWECDSIVHLKDQKKWRIGAYIAVNAILVACIALTLSLATMPKNRGDITVSEFSENYNRLAEYLEINMPKALNEKGEWVTRASDENVIYFSVDLDPPTFHYTEENGNMTGLQFATEVQNSDAWITGYKNEIIVSILSYVRAQQGYSLTSKDIIDVIKHIEASPLDDFQFTSNGVTVSCDYEYSGYQGLINGTLYPSDETGERFFSVEFKMVK